MMEMTFLVETRGHRESGNTTVFFYKKKYKLLCKRRVLLCIYLGAKEIAKLALEWEN